MEFREIKDGSVTLELDPDEAALLAAACKIASYYADEPGCTLTPNPLDALGHAEAAGIALAGYSAMFEAGMTASVALERFRTRNTQPHTFSAPGAWSGVATVGTDCALARTGKRDQ